MNNRAMHVDNIVVEYDTDPGSDSDSWGREINDSTVIGEEFRGRDQRMSGKYKGVFYEQSTTDDSDSDIESDDNVVYRTPARCSVSNPDNHSVRDQPIVITFTNLEDNELEVLQELIYMFDLNPVMSWNDDVTHLIVKTHPSGKCVRTKNILNALLLNRFIVTMEWVRDCLASETLLLETGYIPPELKGEPSPLVSWRVGRGIIASPMEWTSNCVLYLHSTIEFNELFSDIVLWAKRAGFVLARDFRGIKDNYKLRIILADQISKSVSTSVRAIIPNKSEIASWLYELKAVTLFIDWFLECLFQYKFIVINHNYQIMKLTANLIEFASMEESLFLFEKYS